MPLVLNIHIFSFINFPIKFSQHLHSTHQLSRKCAFSILRSVNYVTRTQISNSLCSHSSEWIWKEANIKRRFCWLWFLSSFKNLTKATENTSSHLGKGKKIFDLLSQIFLPFLLMLLRTNKYFKKLLF